MSKIELCTVATVDEAQWTVGVKPLLGSGSLSAGIDASHSPNTDDGVPIITCQLGTAYANIDFGACVGVMPEIGTMGYMMYPDVTDNQSTPILFCFKPPMSPSEGTSGGRQKIEQGDYIITTNGGATILVKNNGEVIIQAGGASVAMRKYGTDSSITDICGDYQIQTKAGSIIMRTGDLLPDALGCSPTFMTAYINRTNSSLIPVPILTAMAGSVPGVKNNVVWVYLSPTEGGTYQYEMNALGQVSEYVNSKKVSALGTPLAEASLPAIPGSIVFNGTVYLGSSAAFESAVKGDSMSVLVGNHYHVAPDGGGPTGGPLVAGTAEPLYTALLNCLSTLVKIF